MRTSESSNMLEYQPSGLIFICQIIAKRSKMIFWCTAGAFILSVVVCVFLSKIYSTRAMVVPASEDKSLRNAMLSQMGGLAILAGEAIGVGTMSDLYVGMLKSETVKNPVIDRLKLMEVYDADTRDDTYKELDKRVSIISGKKDGIISIIAEDKDPKRAADIANTYLDELGKLAVRLNVTGASQNRSFLEERLGKAKADLARAEEDLKIFQSRNKAIHVSSQSEATIKGVAELKAQLALQEVQLATLRRRFTDSKQEVKNLVISVANLRGQIDKLEGTGSNSSIPSVGSVPAIGQAYIRLMREFKIQEALVESLTKQHELAAITEANDVAPLQVLQMARVPSKPVKPKKGFIVVMTTFTVFLCSVIAAFVMERFSVVTAEEREQWKKIRFYNPFRRESSSQ
ncbi:MAG: lipopolysaccharide biosynthesis protein [Deltaproteobacteria bacterium]|nr:lipopolysaccharide biosynthesis protein [Deltaproteobacteria bacterium]TLN01171.1 MAG: lipopolysaccharide biosynthesis protein [bacterium]